MNQLTLLSLLTQRRSANSHAHTHAQWQKQNRLAEVIIDYMRGPVWSDCTANCFPALERDFCIDMCLAFSLILCLWCLFWVGLASLKWNPLRAQRFKILDSFLFYLGPFMFVCSLPPPKLLIQQLTYLQCNLHLRRHFKRFMRWKKLLWTLKNTFSKMNFPPKMKPLKK